MKDDTKLSFQLRVAHNGLMIVRGRTLVIRRKSSIFADKTKLIYGSKKETAPTSRKNSNY